MSDNINKEKDNKLIPLVVKVILIGNSNVGKTSIIKRYVNSEFEEQYQATIGVDFTVKSLIIENYDIKLQIWDTAGMEKYKKITSSYYRGAKAAFVVFDLTDEDSFYAIKNWMEDFCSLCNEKPEDRLIAILGNKADLVEQRKIKREDLLKYVELNKFGYFETSAKENKFIDDAFNFIANEYIKKIKKHKIPFINDNFDFKGISLNTKPTQQTNSKKDCC